MLLTGEDPRQDDVRRVPTLLNIRNIPKYKLVKTSVP